MLGDTDRGSWLVARVPLRLSNSPQQKAPGRNDFAEDASDRGAPQDLGCHLRCCAGHRPLHHQASGPAVGRAPYSARWRPDPRARGCRGQSLPAWRWFLDGIRGPPTGPRQRTVHPNLPVGITVLVRIACVNPPELWGSSLHPPRRGVVRAVERVFSRRKHSHSACSAFRNLRRSPPQHRKKTVTGRSGMDACGREPHESRSPGEMFGPCRGGGTVPFRPFGAPWSIGIPPSGSGAVKTTGGAYSGHRRAVRESQRIHRRVTPPALPFGICRDIRTH